MEFLGAALPIWPGEIIARDGAERHAARVAAAVDGMTMVQRVFAEVEMSQRVTQLHSYDYDPLRFGS